MWTGHGSRRVSFHYTREIVSRAHRAMDSLCSVVVVVVVVVCCCCCSSSSTQPIDRSAELPLSVNLIFIIINCLSWALGSPRSGARACLPWSQPQPDLPHIVLHIPHWILSQLACSQWYCNTTTTWHLSVMLMEGEKNRTLFHMNSFNTTWAHRLLYTWKCYETFGAAERLWSVHALSWATPTKLANGETPSSSKKHLQLNTLSGIGLNDSLLCLCLTNNLVPNS